MRVAVTGGSGELGTHVLRRLDRDRDVDEIVCFDVRPPLAIGRKLRFVKGDVRDRAALERAFDKCDAVFHLAFILARRLPRDVFWGINVQGTKNVFEAAARAGASTIVYASSIAQYGVLPGHPTPIVETTPRKSQPDFPYAATKQEVERWLDAFEPQHPSMSIARIRPGILVGEGMEHGLGRVWRHRLLLSPGDEPLPVVWDEDVADAMILALSKRARGAFNAVADDPRSARDLARATGMRVVKTPMALGVAFARISPWLDKLGIVEAFDEGWLRGGDSTFVVDCAKAKRDLGWAPKCASAIDVMKKFVEIVPARLDPRIAFVFRAAQLASRRIDVGDEMKRADARVWLRLTGEGGGDLGLVVRQGVLSVTRGAPRPPTTILTLPARALLDAIAGRAPLASLAAAGELRVEGEPTGQLGVSAIVEAFRSRVPRPVLRLWAA